MHHHPSDTIFLDLSPSVPLPDTPGTNRSGMDFTHAMQTWGSQIDWSNGEKCELVRLHQTFPPPAFEIECGTSDHQDPWCVVTDCSRDEIIIHIARIDRHYIVANGGNGYCKSFDKLADAVKLAIQQH